jgi:triacylglycerol lipase
LRPGSGFLARLNAGGRLLRGLTLHSYWTPLDLMIVPPQSSVWDLAENHRIWSLCHPCMLQNRQVMAHVHRVMLDQNHDNRTTTIRRSHV